MKLGCLLLLALLVSFSAAPAAADPDTLLPITFGSFQKDLKRSLSKMTVKEDLTPMGCLDGGKEKRTVCTFKLGSYMSVMAESKVGATDVVAVTMICATGSPLEAVKCTLAYAALMTATDPEMTTETRGKIFHVLMDGIGVGNEAMVMMDERKYLLQKSVGLWFHVIAAAGED